MDPSSPLDMNPDKLFVPPETLTYNVTNILAFDGERLHYYFDGKALGIDRKMVSQQSNNVFDGNINKIFWPTGTMKYPTASVESKQKSNMVNQMSNLPLLLAFRPLDSGGARVDPHRFVISAQQGIIKDRPCVIMEEADKSGRGVRELWVDIGRNFSIVRYITRTAKWISTKSDIEFRFDAQNGWVPSDWRTVWFKPDGSVRESYASRVTDYTINEPMADDEFGLEFPAGTWVTDYTMPSGLAQQTDYIVREDGSRRVITADEIGIPYERLIQSDAVSPWRAFLASKGLVIANLTVMVLGLIVLLFRWRNRRGLS